MPVNPHSTTFDRDQTLPGVGSGPWLRAAALAAAVCAAYLPVLWAGYIWDDDMYVVENPTLRDLPGLVRIWCEPRSIPQYYPVVHTTFWIEHHLWGLAPAGYHATNVACHVAGAILLGTFLARLAVPQAWTTAWVFALHPVQVESVAWITERKNVLSFPLAIAAGILLLPILRLDDEGSRPPPGRAGGWYLTALALFVLAVLSKSVVCSLPAVLLLCVWWKRGTIRPADLLVLAPLFILGIAAGLHTAYLERSHVGASGDGFDFTLADRLLIAGRAIVFYAWSLVWPVGLLFNYPRWSIDPSAAWQWCFPVVVALVLAATFAARGRLGRGPFTACAAFCGILFPALGFMNVYPFVFSFVADHFQYHASPALIALLVAAVFAAVSRRLPAAMVVRAWRSLASAALICLALLTCRQTFAYRDLETLYLYTLAGNPGSYLAINNLANVFIDRGRFAEAVPLLGEAIRLSATESQRTLARVTLARVEGRIHRQQGDLPAALAAFRRGLALLPADPILLVNIAEIQQLLGDTEAAERTYRDLLALHPKCAPAMISYGTLLSAAGRTAEAERMYERSLAIAPSARAAYNLAVLMVKANRLRDAALHAARAAQLDPADQDARELAEQLKRPE